MKNSLSLGTYKCQSTAARAEAIMHSGKKNITLTVINASGLPSSVVMSSDEWKRFLGHLNGMSAQQFLNGDD